MGEELRIRAGQCRGFHTSLFVSVLTTNGTRSRTTDVIFPMEYHLISLLAGSFAREPHLFRASMGADSYARPRGRVPRCRRKCGEFCVFGDEPSAGAYFAFG